MGRTRSTRAVEDRIELFEQASPSKDLDDYRLGLLLELGRQLRAASAAEEAEIRHFVLEETWRKRSDEKTA